MDTRLGTNSYGKSKVRLVRVYRDTARHELVEWSVDVQCWGQFEAVHLSGDNAAVLPTDTMKNTVYALAAQQTGREAPELFAARLARHFVENNPPMEAAQVSITDSSWQRIDDHDHSFVRSSGAGERSCSVRVTAAGEVRVAAGIRALTVLKTTGSGFSGFVQDRYTTLAETEDRIFATLMDLDWQYASELDDAAYDTVFSGVRATALELFANEFSPSVQQTGYAIGEQVLARHAEIESIDLSLPNRHCLPVDLGRLGIDSSGEVFLPTDEPHGQINLTVERVRSSSGTSAAQSTSTGAGAAV